MMRIGFLLGVVALLIQMAIAQEEPPLINYAAGIGEFEHDEDPEGRGDNVADGFSWSVTEQGVFTFFKDLQEYYSGNGSQRITISRNGSDSATARLTLPLDFPSPRYPQPGETISISFWVKTTTLQNVRLRLAANGIDGSAGSTLVTITSSQPEWTRFQATYTVPPTNPPGIIVVFIIDALPGAASGTIWLDNLEVYGSQRWQNNRPQRSMKIFTYYQRQQDMANGDWIFYAENFDMVGTFNSSFELRRMKYYRPDLRTLTYYVAFYSVDRNPWPAQDPFGYAYCNANHPEWFLLTVFGQRARYFGDQYLMDVGNPECAAWAAGNMRRRAERANLGWDAIQLDSLADFFYFGNLQRYPTNTSRFAACRKYLMRIKQELSPYSTEIIGNAASAAYTRDRMVTLLLREGALDGLLMEEAFTKIYSFPAEYLSIWSFEAQINTLAENMDKLRVVYSGYTLNPARQRRMKLYALASFLLISSETAFLYLWRNYYEQQPYGQSAWRPDEDFDVPLGEPAGPMQVFFRSSDYRGGLYYRPFTNGIVLVNPTGITPIRVPNQAEPVWKESAVFTWTLDQNYWDLHTRQVLPAGTRIKIYPKQSYILVRAGSNLQKTPPELTTEITESEPQYPPSKMRR